MNKYNIGDKFLIEIESVLSDKDLPFEQDLFKIKGFNSLVFDEYGLNKLQKVQNINISEEQGMNRIWQVAKAIYDMDVKDIEKCFGVSGGFWDVLRTFTPQEAKEKLEAWKKEKEEIKVNDVVHFNGQSNEYIVIEIYHEGEKNEEVCLYKITGDESFRFQKTSKPFLTKTGKTIDIRKMLSKIGSGSNGSE